MPTRTDKEVRNQKLVIGLTTILLVLCYFLYFLRILSRKLLRTPLWIDDWFMLFALVSLSARFEYNLTTYQFVCSGMSTLNYVGKCAFECYQRWY